MKKALVVIDPQNDFIISPEFKGALGVPGAYEDMLRIAEYVRKENPEHIVVTLDTHNTFDIAHNAWWVDKDGNHPLNSERKIKTMSNFLRIKEVMKMTGIARSTIRYGLVKVNFLNL